MRFDSKDHYPKYYKQVFIEYYSDDNDYYKIDKAHLAINDDGEYIWILANNDEIIKDKQVVNWTDFGLENIEISDCNPKPQPCFIKKNTTELRKKLE